MLAALLEQVRSLPPGVGDVGERLWSAVSNTANRWSYRHTREARWPTRHNPDGLIAGLALGFGRMAQGAHFLSHVLWSGIVCWFVLLALYALILLPDMLPRLKYADVLPPPSQGILGPAWASCPRRGRGGGMLPRRFNSCRWRCPFDGSTTQRKEMMMSMEKDTAQGSAAPVATSKKFKDMDFGEKLAYFCKAFVCVITFGFAYPNIFSD